MTPFQLVFRGPDGDQSELRYNNEEGEPQIDGRLVVDGETYVIRGVEWLVRRDDGSSDVARFVCTLVLEPVDA